MYALLMLLPQSEAFKTLHARLHSVPTVTLLKMDGQPPPHAPSAAWDSPALRSRDGSERRSASPLYTLKSQCPNISLANCALEQSTHIPQSE